MGYYERAEVRVTREDIHRLIDDCFAQTGKEVKRCLRQVATLILRAAEGDE